LKSLDKRLQQKRNDYPDTGKDKIGITKISCLGQTKKFYNQLRQTYSSVKNVPEKEEVENIWREIYGNKVEHNTEACRIKNQYQQNSSMEWSPVCEKDVAEVLRTTLNWKAPGRDQIANFWFTQLTATQKHIAALFKKFRKTKYRSG
jgi:virulence-associated protein VapD